MDTVAPFDTMTDTDKIAHLVQMHGYNDVDVRLAKDEIGLDVSHDTDHRNYDHAYCIEIPEPHRHV